MLRRRFFHLCAANISSPHWSEAKIEVEQRIDQIHGDVLRPNDTFGHTPNSTYSMPMVMLLGNHSAGKSTFINHLLDIQEQETGVAPTDDGFTVIMRGDLNIDTDGPSAVSNPQHQFTDLSQYGQNFVNHFRVKTRKLPATSKFPPGMMIVDTPGMIDTPVHVQDRTTLEGQGRGYDFLQVTRWFAQRADVILLMFDPANPGTTGETLDVLTKSLTGLEHKFLILMNKVDMFSKVTDFARAYGTICWNLSKVIRMKDVPRIYTTFTPLLTQDGSSGGKVSHNSGGGGGGVPLQEMDRARREVLEEVLKAPLRRLDNLITEMDEACKRVLLSGRISTRLRRKYAGRRTLVYGGIAVTSLMAPIGIGSVLFTLDGSLILLSSMVSLLSASGAALLGRKHLRDYERHLVSTIDSVVDEVYPGKLKTTETRQRWELSVKPALLEFLKVSGVSAAEVFAPSGTSTPIAGTTTASSNSSAAANAPNLITSKSGSGKSPSSSSSSSLGGLLNLPTMSNRTMRKLESVFVNDVPALRTKVAAYKEELLRSANR